MGTILHLSDLHLSTRPGEDTLNDVKAGAVDVEHQQSRLQRLHATLESIRDDPEIELDCIVVSGDIVEKFDADAFDLLPRLLAPLVPDVVPKERVVVVPGNHDVPVGAGASMPERYVEFLRVRAFGYITPYLEGVDISVDGSDITAHDGPVLIARDNSFAIVAVNSANHCHAPVGQALDTDPDWPRIEELAAVEPSIQRLVKRVRGAEHEDVAWIDKGQQKRAAQALAEATAGSPTILRIAVLHHHIYPPTDIAELKPYESILNLGEFLEWMDSSRIDVILHGHKHSPHVAAHARAATASNHPESSRRLYVSAPTARAGYDTTAPVARLVTVPPLEPRSAGVDVQAVRVAAHQSSHAATSELRRYRLDESIEHGVVEGRTSAEVQRKLVALRDQFDVLAHPLVCVVHDGPSARVLPDGYPDIPTGTDPTAWFAETVKWWEGTSSSTARFTHGQRIRAWGSGPSGKDGFSQLDRVVAALDHKGTSSRALMVLMDPRVDLIATEEPFPAFTSAQFMIRDNRLDVVAYFRKQEMPHWWAVNAAELAELQDEVCQRVHGKYPGLQSGSVTTITAIPVTGGGVPRVLIPWLDRYAASPAGLLPLVTSMLVPGDAARSERAWENALRDWEPSVEPPADGDPYPHEGLRDLADAIQVAVDLHGSSAHVARVVSGLRSLHTVCSNYARCPENDRLKERPEWVMQVGKLTNDTLTSVRLRFAELEDAADAPPGS